MNWQRLIAFNIQGLLILAITLAIFLPLTLLARLSFSSAYDLAINNLEAYIEETGARQRAGIENDFRTALVEINRFLDASDNLETLVEPLQIRINQGTAGVESERLENNVSQLFLNELIDTGYFNSIWLLTPIRQNTLTGLHEANTLATTTAPGQSLPFNRVLQNESTSEISQVGLRLQLDIGSDGIAQDTQALVVTQREDGEQHVEVINLIYDVSREQARFVGYLVADLNLQRIVNDNLIADSSEFDPYSYVILPNERDFIALPDVREANLIDLNSLGAQRILARQASNVDRYEVSSGDDQREVLGYYAPIIIEDSRFSLITEIDTAVVRQRLFGYIASISFPVLIGSFVLLFLLVLILTQYFVPPLNQIRDVVRGIVRGNFDVPLTVNGRSDEVGQLALTVAEMRDHIRELNADMERRLRNRTRDVRVTQDIARAVTAERNLDRLMTQVVNLIVENFPTIYHAQIFLVDEDRKDAVLRASTGEAGQYLLQRGHKLAIGSVSVIGQVTEQGQVIVARDTAESDVHRRNEFLQDTRAELAIPLELGGEVIGALDVQSKQRDSFDDDQVAAIQTLADQITIAIENARLYQQSNRLLNDLEHDRRTRTRESWQQYMYARRQNDIVMKAGVDTGHSFETINQYVLSSGKPYVGEITERETVPFAIPIRLRGEILGTVEYEISKAEFSYDKVLLAEELVNRLAISLDNARLFQESQDAVERERIVNDISTRITGQTDVETILQTAVREVEIALRTPRVAIKLARDKSTNSASGNGSNGHTS